VKFLAFAASHRPESLNKKLIELATRHLREAGEQVDVAEYGEFDMPVYNDTYADSPPPITKKFAERCTGADGLIIALPEYNWSYPASLKNIIDWTSLIKPNPVAGKTVFLMSATTGGRGGITGLQHIKSPLEALHMHIFHKVFPLSYAQDAFTKEGELEDSAKQALFTGLIKDYITFTRKISST
jgi:NAD(P)H-dependent FMN reductase